MGLALGQSGLLSIAHSDGNRIVGRDGQVAWRDCEDDKGLGHGNGETREWESPELTGPPPSALYPSAENSESVIR